MKIYFMGICGTAMGNAALLMKSLGHDVIGADTNIYPPMSDLLLNSGIKIYDEYNADRLSLLAPDLVVVGNIVSRGHPEMEWLLETNALNYVSLPELLRTQLLKFRKSIVISGTHGKTTTSSITAFLLRENNKQPGWLIGGVPKDLETGANPGIENGPFVIEGDEYDTSFFDKRSKFIQYLPKVLVINNIEFDHADIFRDLKDVQRTFSHVIKIVPNNGLIIINGDDNNIEEIIKNVSWAKILRVGLGENCNVRIKNFSENECGSSFTIAFPDKTEKQVSWNQSGIFNARNATMATCAAQFFCGENIDIEEPLSRFQGIKRRREILVDTPEIVCIEDFGHHPTAINCTLTALKQHYPKRKIIIAFEPRSNTSVRNIMQKEFTNAFSLADSVYIAPIFRPERFADTDVLHPSEIAQDLEKKGIKTTTPASIPQLLNELIEEADSATKEKPALVVFFSNGAFGGIIQQFANNYKSLF